MNNSKIEFKSGWGGDYIDGLDNYENHIVQRESDGVVGRLVLSHTIHSRGHGESNDYDAIKFINAQTLRLEIIKKGEKFCLLK